MLERKKRVGEEKRRKRKDIEKQDNPKSQKNEKRY